MSLPWLFLLGFSVIIPSGALVIPDGVKLFILLLYLAFSVVLSGVIVEPVRVIVRIRVVPDGVSFIPDGVQFLEL